MAQGLRALVTNSYLRCSHSAGGSQMQSCLHENKEMIFRSKTLTLYATFHRSTPTTFFEEMSENREQRPPSSEHVSSEGGISMLNSRYIELVQRFAKQTSIATVHNR